MPRLIDEPVSLKTTNGSANRVKELPRLEMVWPSQKRPKSPDGSQLRQPFVSALMSAFWRAGPTPARALPEAVSPVRRTTVPRPGTTLAAASSPAVDRDLACQVRPGG